MRIESKIRVIFLVVAVLFSTSCYPGVYMTGSAVPLGSGCCGDNITIYASANLTASGTAGYLAKWLVSNQLGNSTNTDAQIAAAVAASHARQHTITSVADHLSAATPGRMLQADANGLPINATNTDAQVAASVAATHVSGADTTLGVQVANLNMGGDNITNVGYVDGYDVSVIGAASHTQNTDTGLGVLGVKNPPIDADKSIYRDSAAGDALVTSTWLQIKAFLKLYFDTLYGAGGGNVTYSVATLDYIPKWSPAGNLINSTVSSNATSVYVNNNLNMMGDNITNVGYVDGVDVSAIAFTDNTTGTGTSGRIVRWTGFSTQNNSNITDNTTAVYIANNLQVSGNLTSNLQVSAGITIDGVDVSTLSAGTGNVTTSGFTANYIPKATTATNLANSHIYDNGTYVSIGTVVTTSPDASLEILNGSGITPQARLTYNEHAIYTDLLNNGLGYFSIMPTGLRVGINDLAPASALDVTGTIHNTQAIDSDSDINAGNDLSADNDLNVTDDADIGGDLRVIGTANATRFISYVTTGTAPFTVVSTTNNTNLNADLLDGQHATAFALVGAGTGNVTYTQSTLDYVPKWSPVGNLVDSTISSNATSVYIVNNLNMSGDNITNVGYVDGYDVSVIGAASHTQGTDTTLGTMTANITMGTYYINTLHDPSVAQDAATKNYVDTHTTADNTTGTGTANTLVRWTGLSTQNNSNIVDNTTATYINNNLQVSGNLTSNLQVSSGVTVDGVDVSNLPTVGIELVIDGGGSVIMTGIKGDLEIPFACTINRATALADTTGTANISIWKDTYANYPPTISDNITANAQIATAGADKAQDSTLTGWTTTINSGDILRYNMDYCSNITRVTISLRAVRQ